MSHVFVSPHPDDVALSCGGLIAGLRELGQQVTILTVYSGSGNGSPLTRYQREALGFGSKALWPVTEAFNRASILPDYLPNPEPEAMLPPWAVDPERLQATQDDADASAKRFWQRASWYRRASIEAKPLAGQVLVDDIPTQGAVVTDEVLEAAAAGELMARRRLEDERYAYFSEASIVFLDFPDAVFRGYEGDEELLSYPRLDDDPPTARIRAEIARLEPQVVYVPLGVGGHVDHQLCRDVGIALTTSPRSWVMPGPEWAGKVVFYEDFPYAWWRNFDRLDQLPTGALDGLGRDVTLTPEYADITDQQEKKITGISIYESQLERLFGGERQMGAQVRAYGAKTAELGGVSGAAERYWHTLRG